MKKQLLFLALVLLPLAVSASVEIDGLRYNLNANGHVAEVVSAYPFSYKGSVVIPKNVTYEGVNYSVTSIGEMAFANCTDLTSVTISNSVTSIGSNAFKGCSSLTSVTIPNSVKSLGYRAFRSCIGLTSVTIGNGVTSIGDEAFAYCIALTSVTIGNHLTSIGKKAFENCHEITSVTIPSSVTSIGQGAFELCDGITSVHISDLSAWCRIVFGNGIANPLYTAHHLYLNNQEVTKLVIPNDVTSIGNNAFTYCTGITSVTIPNSVTSIGKEAFVSCTGITSLVIPNSVTSIGETAFANCSGLTSVSIPSSVTSINYGVFWICTSLTSVVIPNSVTNIDGKAFNLCSNLSSVTIGSGIKSIDSEAFAYCEKLKDVYCYAATVPNTKTNAFDNSPIQSATLYVPAASVNAYKTTEPWKNFKVLMPISGTGIVQVSDRSMLIQSLDGMITVDGAEDGTEVQVYTMDGRQAGSTISRNGSATVSTNLATGSVAVIKIGDRSFKVAIK